MTSGDGSEIAMTDGQLPTKIAQRARDIAIQRLAHPRWRHPGPGVALTFDDGPDPEVTPKLLDLLAQHDVRATFFCTGRNAARHPDLVRRANDEGHVVGSHSWSHPHPARTSGFKLLRDYRRGHAVLRAVLQRPDLPFRPPHGFLSPRTGVAVRALATDCWLWSVDPEDWRSTADHEAIAAAVADARDGDVVLLHDGAESPEAPAARDRSSTLLALAEAIPIVLSRGGRFTPLPIQAS